MQIVTIILGRSLDPGVYRADGDIRQDFPDFYYFPDFYFFFPSGPNCFKYAHKFFA
jgi:hypothetical protein